MKYNVSEMHFHEDLSKQKYATTKERKKSCQEDIQIVLMLPLLLFLEYSLSLFLKVVYL